MKIVRPYTRTNNGSYVITCYRYYNNPVVTKFDNTVAGRIDYFKTVEIITMLFNRLDAHEFESSITIKKAIMEHAGSNFDEKVRLFETITGIREDHINSIEFSYRDKNDIYSVYVDWSRNGLPFNVSKLNVVSSPYTY